MDLAGIVEDVGSGVKDFKIGDRVYSTLSECGAYADYQVSEDRNVFHLPSQLTFQEGAGIGCVYFTAIRSLFHIANCKAGETVFVHGASGGRIAFVQIARAHGMQVIGTAGTAEGMEIVKKQGAHYVFNHREDGYMGKIKELTDGKGVDAIMEMNAHLHLVTDLDILSNGGRLVVVGRYGNIAINPRDIMLKEAKILGVMLPNSTTAERRDIGAAINDGIQKGWLRPLIWKEFPLKEASEAHRLMANGHGAKGRIVLNMI
uniref:Quinone oxidoreductase-like n=1 Tax=Saccoglossus kowalevskii TaxID=10224 RepID=A0ABM0MJU4_SACKO|nr:PREDICTED: quinone oxidoreductase-like [Saccoglossus kowalevskii]